MKSDAASLMPSRRVELLQRFGALAAGAQLDACKSKHMQLASLSLLAWGYSKAVTVHQ